MKEIRKTIRKALFESEETRIKFLIPIPEEIEKIKNIFISNGHKLYIVGGAVRDSLLDKIPKDYDLATDAMPDKVISMLKNADFINNILETGKSFGVINVITPSGEFEIATFRSDVGSGRRPDAVKFTTIDQDVKRRDLTINALFYDIDTNEVIDLVGGIEDLKNGVIKTVGSAINRFEEDRLRILRAIRFAARFGSELDSEVDKALNSDSSLENISVERIRDEFLKGIKTSKSVIYFFDLINKYNLFKWIFPGLKIGKFVETKNYPVLLAILLKENELMTLKKALNNLSYTVEEIAKITYLISFENLDINVAYIFKKNLPNSKLSSKDLIEFAKIVGMDMLLVNSFLQFNLSVSGHEIMQKGFKGIEIGKEIQRIETEKFKKMM